MNTLAVAGVTLREVLRRKVQVNLLLFGGILIVASYLISTLTLGEMHRMVADLGLSAMRLIGTLLAVFLGATLVAGDIERRVISAVITKPISRAEYLLGRYAGLAVALLANLLAMAVVLALVLAASAQGKPPIDAAFAAAIAMMAVQFLVVAAVAVLFSSLTNVTLAAIFTLAVAIAGQLTNEMRSLWKGGAVWLAKLVWYVVPNLGALNANEAVIYRTAPPAGAWLPVVYGLLYIATVLTIAALTFERRDLK